MLACVGRGRPIYGERFRRLTPVQHAVRLWFCPCSSRVDLLLAEDRRDQINVWVTGDGVGHGRWRAGFPPPVRRAFWSRGSVIAASGVFNVVNRFGEAA